VHPVFLVSLVNKKLGHGVVPSTMLREIPNTDRVLKSQAILDFRGKDQVREVLIHWHGFSPADATWERVETMLQQFPKFTLEDKGAS
jgi:hypothetical protein